MGHTHNVAYLYKYIVPIILQQYCFPYNCGNCYTHNMSLNNLLKKKQLHFHFFLLLTIKLNYLHDLKIMFSVYCILICSCTYRHGWILMFVVNWKLQLFMSFWIINKYSITLFITSFGLWSLHIESKISIPLYSLDLYMKHRKSTMRNQTHCFTYVHFWIDNLV